MSHFLTVVLLKPNEANPAEAAKALMWPYFAPDLASARPKAKCDGFRIGGSYDGDIWGKEQHYNLTPAEYQARYGRDVVRPEDNIRPVEEVRSDFVPFAVITPDGQWRDCEDKDEDTWQREWAALLAEHSGHIAVAIDCHC